MNREKISYIFWGAIEEQEIDEIRSTCHKHPWLITDHFLGKVRRAGIVVAAGTGNPVVVQVMLDIGFSINAVDMPQEHSVLCEAVRKTDLAMLEFLLSKGADPAIGRPIIEAMNCGDAELALAFVKLLVEHGADVNKLYELYGDKNNLFTALDWARKPEIVKYLREHGAKRAADLRNKDLQKTRGDSRRPLSDQVVAYFEENFGPVNRRAQTEIVPSGVPVSIHAIEPKGDRKHLTLFTTGLSSKERTVPVGQEDFALAELFIQLPADWEYRNMAQSVTAWPLRWLRRLAQYPHKHKTWLGGPFTIVANKTPPQPPAPNTRFTCVLLLAEESFKSDDGRKVYLYRMTPLYTEERDMKIREGAPALMRAFDRHSISSVVDLNRKNVTLHERQ